MAAAQQDDDEVITSINVTPLVDIVLVLLIIFMMTASYIVTPAIRVELPKAASAESVVQSLLALVLTREGDLFLNNQKVTDDELRAFIRTSKAEGKDLEAVIAADASVRHGRVVGLIDLIKAEGIVKFAINTDADFTSGGAKPSTDPAAGEGREPSKAPAEGAPAP
ncbi:biopolymer transporter ExbD [Myxococcota bacterium]|nr:biopolymer transporter ExbD [Myxococcota bacterium]